MLNRREILKSGPLALLCSGAVHADPALPQTARPARLGDAIGISQGNRELRDITEAEIDEIIAWARLDRVQLDTVDIDDKTSFHSKYRFVCGDPEDYPEDFIECGYAYHWFNEYAESDVCIYMGSIHVEGYPIDTADKMIRWFLERGFKVFDEPMVDRRTEEERGQG